MGAAETQPPVAVIGAGLDLGAGRRGVDMGPSAIRYAGLDERIVELGRRCEDWGDVVTAVAEATAVGDEHMRYLTEIKATVERIAALVAQAAEAGYAPVVLGGDHSSRLAHSAEWRVPAAAAACSGRRARDLNRPRRRRAGTSTGCRSRPRSASPGRRSRATNTRFRPSIRVGSHSSASDRSTPASARCWPSSRRGCSR
jgi:hypothetical protein